MSTPKLISPLLDNFMMGDPISEENGVRCCPAMNQQTQEKFLVKIISVPASQTKLEALLLTGAYPDAQAAGVYFKQQADEITAEADVLKRLSRSGGFEGFEASQVVPMDDGTGYDVYLLYPYRKTLERYCQSNSVTHLEATNMALDVCAALASCRNQGYIFLNLKPENILFAPDKSYRIGDLGLLQLDSLKYASIPERYFSPYTAPELTDAFSEPNETVDTYALGMILYQIYNGGALPFDGERAPAEALPAPQYADAEIAEIILKACAPDPTDRWQTPAQMGQALVACIQRNGISDTPIVILPPEPEILPEEDVIEAVPTEETTEPEVFEEACEVAEEAPAEDVDVPACEEALAEEPEEAPAIEEVPEPDEAAEEAATDEPAVLAPVIEEATEIEEPTAELSEEPEMDASVDEPASEPEHSEEVPEEEDFVNLSFLDPDDVQPDDEQEPEDIESVLSQVDALLSDIPDVEEESTEPEDEETEKDTLGAIPFPYEDEEDDELAPVKKRSKAWIGWVLAAVLLAGLLVGGYFFYTGYYLQPVNQLTVDATKDVVVITVDCPLDSSELSILLTDEFYEKISIPLIGGKATISGLQADMTYTVTVETSSFHKLTGNTTATFDTQKLTEILNFTVVTGNTAGTAVLSFQVSGPDSENWTATFTATDGTNIIAPFTGHSVTVEGLTVGTEYTVTVNPEDSLYIAEIAPVTYVSSEVITAESIAITDFTDGKLTATWTAPEDAQVSGWTVLCTGTDGYSQVLTVTDAEATFEGIDQTAGYTVSVMANNQSVGLQAAIEGGAPTISGLTASASANANRLTVFWNAPEGNWKVQYRIVGSEYTKEVSCSGTSVTITDVVPGQTYGITILTADGKVTAHAVTTVKISEAVNFTGYTVSRNNMQFRMCKTPSKSNWSRVDLRDSDYTTTFTTGQKASFLIRLNKTYNTSPDTITSLFVIKDADGNVVHTCSSASSWTNMWYGGYCELDIPSLPTEAGSYTITVYFNGAFAYTGSFTITG